MFLERTTLTPLRGPRGHGQQIGHSGGTLVCVQEQVLKNTLQRLYPKTRRVIRDLTLEVKQTKKLHHSISAPRS